MLRNLSRRLVFFLAKNDQKILKRPVLQHKRRTSAVSGTENKKSSRPSARLDASTEITKKNRQSHRATEPFTPFGHFLAKNDHKILKRLVLQHKRRTSAVPGTDKKSSSRPSARLDASTEITKKNRQSHRATEPFTPFGHFFGKK